MNVPALTEADLPPRLAAYPAKQRAALLADMNRRLAEAPTPPASAVTRVGALVERFRIETDTRSAA